METISFCIPCHNRTYDLEKSMGYLIESANASPPVEIMILDYNSPDYLADYIKQVLDSKSLNPENILSYCKYQGQNYYHMAHARNLSARASSGSIITIMSSDICPQANFVSVIREQIKNYDCLLVNNYRGILTCRKEEFMGAGGYDERFEFYGPEDKDLELRLLRRGNRIGTLSSDLLSVIPTPNKEKAKNYRLPISKREMSQRMKPILEENIRKRILVANEGVSWGQGLE